MWWENVIKLMIVRGMQTSSKMSPDLDRIIVKLEILEAADELHTMADAAGGTDDLDGVNAIVREFRERRPYRA